MAGSDAAIQPLFVNEEVGFAARGYGYPFI